MDRVTVTENLKRISEITGNIFVEVLNGEAKYILTGEVIPVQLIIYQSQSPDGFYVVGQMTCDGSCSIGTPKKECVENGSYSLKKCSVYDFDPVKGNSIHLSFEQLFDLMQNK